MPSPDGSAGSGGGFAAAATTAPSPVSWLAGAIAHSAARSSSVRRVPSRSGSSASWSGAAARTGPGAVDLTMTSTRLRDVGLASPHVDVVRRPVAAGRHGDMGQGARRAPEPEPAHPAPVEQPDAQPGVGVVQALLGEVAVGGDLEATGLEELVEARHPPRRATATAR